MPKQGSKPYILTRTAEQDFRDAKSWSMSRWGKELTKNYFSDIHQTAEKIANNSKHFSQREDLTYGSGVLIAAVREHYILYVPLRRDTIIIIALIRQTRDVPSILQANSYRISREIEQIVKAK